MTVRAASRDVVGTMPKAAARDEFAALTDAGGAGVAALTGLRAVTRGNLAALHQAGALA
jgi:hypothetical protein